MKPRRNIENWVLEPSKRLTLSQQIGGLLYDFIAERTIVISENKTKQLLTCVREETRMSDRTLKRVFRGESDSTRQQQRILCAIHEWVGTDEYLKLWHDMGVLQAFFFSTNGNRFLEEEAEVNRPKRKAPE